MSMSAIEAMFKRFTIIDSEQVLHRVENIHIEFEAYWSRLKNVTQQCKNMFDNQCTYLLDLD